MRNVSIVRSARVSEQLDRHLRLVAKLRGRDLADEMRAALSAHVERAADELTPDDERPAPRAVAESRASGERERAGV